MKAYYKRGWGISFLSFGIVLLALNLYLINEGVSAGMRLIVPVMMCIFGPLYLTKPVFELTDKEILVYNTFGMVVKRYAFESLSDLKIEDGRIFINRSNGRERVRISKVMVRNEDWDAIAEKIESNDISKELHGEL